MMDTRILMLSGLFLFFCHVLSSQASSKEILPAPYNLQIEKWNLTWTPGTEDKNVTHVVEFRSFRSDTWRPLPECINISTNFCDFSSSTKTNDQDCMMLRVRAEQHGRRSSPVEACSTHGGLCSPQFRMTAGPGSITIHLSRNNSLFLDNADHAKYDIYFWKDGEKQEIPSVAASSVFMNNLEVGQRYCAKVMFTLYGKPYGVARCIQCEVVPAPSDSKGTVAIATVVVVIILLVLVPVIAYVLIFQHERIKKILMPPSRIPDFLLSQPSEGGLSVLPRSSSKEDCDLVSVMTPYESRGD